MAHISATDVVEMFYVVELFKYSAKLKLSVILWCLAYMRSSKLLMVMDVLLWYYQSHKFHNISLKAFKSFF